jgi:hypothetical protein
VPRTWFAGGSLQRNATHNCSFKNELANYSNSPVHDPLFMLYFSSFLLLHQQHAGHKFKLDPLPENLAWMAASEFILDAAI